MNYPVPMTPTPDAPENLDLYPTAPSNDALGAVPVIDLGPLLAGDEAGLDEIADAVGRACREWGFFQVVNHGVSAQTVDAAWTATREFFARPRTEKERWLRTRENPWGYYNNELTKNRRDRKEVFDFTTDGEDPIYEMENRWPGSPPGFREALAGYRDAVTALGLRLLRAFSVGLGLSPDHFGPLFDTSHTGFVRLNYYPVADPLADSDVVHQPEAELGVHHHTDAGALTVLAQDAVGGLQVFRAGQWHDVHPVEGAFVINTGDMMQVWSNDLYQAAVHRVLAMKGTDRYSIPFFFNPAAGAVVEPLPGAVSSERPPRYRPIPWSDFRYKRTDGDYADYGPEVQISQYRI